MNQVRAQSAVGGEAEDMVARARGDDDSRMRSGLIVLVLGVVLILWSWGNWAYRAATPDPAASSGSTRDDIPDTVQTTSLLPEILVYSLILAFLVIFGGYAVVRIARRYRDSANRERAGPSASLDVWAMHKVPDYDHDEDPLE